MRAARWSAVAFAVLLLAGCGQTHAQSGDGALHLTAKDNNQQFTIQRNEGFEVALPSNRSTGYRWEQTAGSTANDVGARLVSHRYVGAANLPGSGGKEIWRFRAVGRGALPLGFAYVLPSDRHKPPAQSVGFLIVVR